MAKENVAQDQAHRSRAEDPLSQAVSLPHFHRTLGLYRPFGKNIKPRTIVVILVGWAPLAVLVIAQSTTGESHLPSSFLSDIAIHARSLIAVPLFILCEPICLRRLEKVVTQFVTAGLVRSSDRVHFEQLIASMRRWANSTGVEIVVLAGIVAVGISLPQHFALDGLPAWYSVKQGNGLVLSWAGWWALLVSIPLLLILFLGWMWRIVLWARFLFGVSRMRLRLIAAHPDLACGLMFLNTSFVAFMPLALTIGIIAAGPVANRVVRSDGSLQSMKYTIVGLLVFEVILFVLPLLVFSINLQWAKVSGVLAYGELANNVGRQFESKWFEQYQKYRDEALESANFSATTDLYQIVANVHSMRLVPFELKALISFLAITLIPFIPVVLLVIPLDVVWREVLGLLF